LLSGWVALLLIVAPAHGAEPVQVIELKHRSAAEILPLIQPLLKPGEGASATDYRLLVRASDASLHEIRRAVAELDAAGRLLLITVRQVPQTDTPRILRQLSAARPSGDSRVTTTVDAQTSSEARSGDETAVRYHTKRGEIDLETERTQVLTVAEGRHAYVRVAQSVPHVENIIHLSGKTIDEIKGATLQDVSTGFDLVARLRDGVAWLEIAPRLQSLANPDIGRMDFTSLATTATVRLGTWTDIGATLDKANAVSSVVMESTTADSGERQTLLLKVELTGGAAR
jgi:hypothetical protein